MCDKNKCNHPNTQAFVDGGSWWVACVHCGERTNQNYTTREDAVRAFNSQIIEERR